MRVALILAVIGITLCVIALLRDRKRGNPGIELDEHGEIISVKVLSAEELPPLPYVAGYDISNAEVQQLVMSYAMKGDAAFAAFDEEDGWVIRGRGSDVSAG